MVLKYLGSKLPHFGSSEVSAVRSSLLYEEAQYDIKLIAFVNLMKI